MKFILEITVDNAAFYRGDGRHEPEPEIARILGIFARRVDDEFIEGVDWKGGPWLLQDANGNTVGRARFTKR